MNILKVLLPVLFIAVFSIFLTGESLGYKVIKNPKPTFTEGKMELLFKVGELKNPPGQELAIVNPGSMITDSSGNLYIYDPMLAKIVKYDRDLNFVKSVGDRGEGPGDFKVSSVSHGLYLYYNNGYIYAYNQRGRQILWFDSDLNFIDMEWIKANYLFPSFSVDKDKNFYFCSLKGGIRRVDRSMEVQAKLLYDLDMYEFLFYDPPKCLFGELFDFRQLTLKFELISGSRLIVYSFYTSTVYFFEKDSLKRKFNIYSEPVLNSFKKTLDRKLKKWKKRQSTPRPGGRRRGLCSYRRIFTNFFMDGDDNQSFYLQYYDGENRKSKVFRFNLHGKLLNTYYINFNANNEFPHFELKKNQRFYATDREGKVLTYRGRR